jgi:hypothetical protein
MVRSDDSRSSDAEESVRPIERSEDSRLADEKGADPVDSRRARDLSRGVSMADPDDSRRIDDPLDSRLTDEGIVEPELSRESPEEWSRAIAKRSRSRLGSPPGRDSSRSIDPEESDRVMRR